METLISTAVVCAFPGLLTYLAEKKNCSLTQMLNEIRLNTVFMNTDEFITVKRELDDQSF